MEGPNADLDKYMTALPTPDSLSLLVSMGMVLQN
jgi:hypothetical protein